MGIWLQGLLVLRNSVNHVWRRSHNRQGGMVTSVLSHFGPFSRTEMTKDRTGSVTVTGPEDRTAHQKDRSVCSCTSANRHPWFGVYTVWLITASTASARIVTHRHASDRIGTHIYTSAPILTTSTRQNRGRGIKVQFQGFNIGQIAGKVSNKWIVGAP